MGVARVVVSAAVLLAAVGATEAVAPGAARAATAANAKTIRLVLTVAKGESTSAPGRQRASLTCQPAGGTHKQARSACSQLAKVGGRPDRLQLGGGACTMQWDPVTVTANGSWKGRKVAYSHTFGNACSLSMTTGAVFSL
jgi:hypothetical protein